MKKAEAYLEKRPRTRQGESFYVTPALHEEAFLDTDLDFVHTVLFDDGGGRFSR